MPHARLLALTTVLGLICTQLTAAASPPSGVIPNDLGLNWPNDLTYLEVPVASLGERNAVAIHLAEDAEPILRPGQVERMDGSDTARVWFMATIRNPSENGGQTPRSVPIQLHPETDADSSLTLAEHDDHYLIRNGMFEFRLRRYPGKLDEPTPLGDLRHWLMGARPAGAQQWDGRAHFDGSSRVTEAHTRIIAQGPVFIDAHITYVFDEAGEEGTTDALPLAMGKQTHTWEPNEPPRETVPRRQRHLELIIRFVADDPWVEVNERFHLPGDDSVPGFGIHQQWFHWGKPPADFPHGKVELPANQFTELDTASWVRWFEYDSFGGNVNQNDVPLVPREAQRGRPFALLRPRWNQGGGGAQDLVVWKGGSRPYYDRQTRQTVVPEGYDPDSPAFGIVAAFASKWVGPYPNTIAAYVQDGDRAFVRLPLRDGEPGRSGMHYGQRSYALLIGPRSQFNSLNNIVRRHTDWTLVAQHHHYILDWERDPDLAGPNIYITRKQLDELRKRYSEGNDPALVEAIAATRADFDELQVKLAAAKEAEDRQAERDAQNALHRVEFDVLRLILGEPVARRPRIPDAGLWIHRRYQDDFLNPTSRTVRQINHDLPMVDLFTDGRPLGGRDQAVIGYVFTDLDHWPGWHHGWSPGNPNFHTDKYMPAAMIGAAMRDHPHAEQWLAFAYDNFLDDLSRVFYEPDGVGYECPGYAGYSMNLQIDTARLFYNAGFANAMVENPMIARSAEWHRHLITPVNPRIGRRHTAPIGDTHRWDSGLQAGFGKLAVFFKDVDPQFASQLVGAMSLINPGRSARTLMGRVIEMDPAIEPMDPMTMDWTGRTFFGFGAIMRDKFGSDEETFMTFKAGHARGHAHNEELSWHFYSRGTPISLDYNCSYTPRMDHAAMHNSMTFGNTTELIHNQRGHRFEAMEELTATGHVGAFVTTPQADLVVAERRGRSLVMRPHDPEHNEFGRQYPSRETDQLVHRRFVALIKHPEGSAMPDYLVIRDETTSNEPQQINTHFQARDAVIDGDTVRLPGQWDKDTIVRFISATDLKIDHRAGWYHDIWQSFPEEVLIRPGETQEQWAQRFAALNLPGNKTGMVFISREAREAGEFDWYYDRIRQTQGKAMMPPPGWEGTWPTGEYQVWLRAHTAPGTPTLWVMVPYPRGSTEPTIEPLADGTAVRISVGDQSDIVSMPGTGHAVTLTRGDQTITLLEADALPELGAIPTGPLNEARDEREPG